METPLNNNAEGFDQNRDKGFDKMGIDFTQSQTIAPQLKDSPEKMAFGAPLNISAQLGYSQNKNNIDIKITDHFTKVDTFRDYTLYNIKGLDEQGVIDITRRYSDFFLIRRTLVIRWPGCYIPPLPPKNLLKNMEAEFVKERRFALETFVQKVAGLSYLHYSREYQTFLRFMGADLEKELKIYQKIFYDETIQRYATAFQHLSEIQTIAESSNLAARFKTFLLKASQRLRFYKGLTKEVTKAKKKYYEGLAVFQTNVASEYERDIIGEYQNFTNLRSVFSDPNNLDMDQNVTKLRTAISNPSIEYFDNWMETEILQIGALMEAIEQKDKLEKLRTSAQSRQKGLQQDINDISSGQFTFKTLFSSKNKETHIAEINEQIANCSKEIENLTMLLDMVTLVISHVEIEKFKSHKSEKFYQVIDLASQNELDNLTAMTEYWSMIKNRNQNK